MHHRYKFFACVLYKVLFISVVSATMFKQLLWVGREIKPELGKLANIPVTRDTFNDEGWMYRCYTLHVDTSVKELQ